MLKASVFHRARECHNPELFHAIELQILEHTKSKYILCFYVKVYCPAKYGKPNDKFSGISPGS